MWEREFGNIMNVGMRAVADDLRDWGFNTIGRTQEVVIITEVLPTAIRGLSPMRNTNGRTCLTDHLSTVHRGYISGIKLRSVFPMLMSSDFEEWCDGRRSR